MNWKTKTKSFLKLAFAPIRGNANFFIFMYLLGIICAVVTTPRWGVVYDNLALELFVDVYVVCALLMLVPKKRKIRFCVRSLLYIILYVTALADTYCFVNFGSTLNPSMLMLVGETNPDEASNFISACLSPTVIFSAVGWILLLILVQAFVAAFRKPIIKSLGFAVTFIELLSLKKRWNWVTRVTRATPYALTVIGIIIFITGACTSWHNKMATFKLFGGKNIGEVEHELTNKGHAELYIPINRLAFSIYANKLAAKQITQLIHAAKDVRVDSCSYRSSNIVLIIGESYGRHHSQQYGYFMKTTPRQAALEKSRKLTKFTDVVTCWNLTSFVFKNVFSTHVVGQEGEWCDYPLFTTVFRKAGYTVTFITNQFLPKAKEAVYDFSGGFFLNNPELSKLQFDNRNSSVHYFDEGILHDYDKLLERGTINMADKGGQPKANLIIFHVMGQHVNYHSRYPKSQRRWYADDYDRPDLSRRKRDILSHYDNATLYNDSIVDQILQRFENRDAIAIYFSDHGEECFNDGFQYHGRNHSAVIDERLAHQEFDVPFWVWCSHDYAVNHPDILSEVLGAKERRLMTDALPHLLFYLAGIHSKDYHEEYNVLSPSYDEKRPRVIKATVDYDNITNH